MKRLFSYFLIIISCFFALFVSADAKNLTIATEATFPPYEYYSNGEIVGVDIDIMKRVAEELNEKLIVKDVTFDSIISEVKTGKSDIGASGISYTPERAEQVDFSDSYIDSNQVLVVRTDSYITGIDDLNGLSVAVQLGTVADSYLTDNYPGIKVVREKKFLAAIQDVKDGKVDAVFMDYVPATQFQGSELKILENPVMSDTYSFAVAKGNTELLEAINKVIAEMKETGEIEKLLIKHLKNQNNIDTTTNNSNSFLKMFEDGRFKFILEGLGNTLLIAFFAVIIGIILGTLIALIRSFHDNTGKLVILNQLVKLYTDIIRGTPSTLQLMIIYYIIFASVDVNIVLVGIIAFGINSSAYVAEIIRGGINSIDKGQMEAGYALGLNFTQIMKYIILKPAVRNSLPALGNEFITLIKETSIGAYIGIVELTKASDIIASRTYNYFLPLIFVALIYLVITFILSRLVSAMEKRLKV